MATFSCGSFSAAFASLAASPNVKAHQPADFILQPNNFKPISCTTTFLTPTSRLRVSQTKTVSPKRFFRPLAVSGLADGNSEPYPEDGLGHSDAGPTIDIKLPRRSLLVQFTCNECGERTQRLINRLAYERGLVYAQCAGCERYHKLADNLGLVIEYDLQQESSAEENTDQA
uniref:Uncharacterized protein LOC105641948 n=1 Tax=Rhizophora mucronata TaxID=61149 RepID=A0A2P2ING6_RHIMU